MIAKSLTLLTALLLVPLAAPHLDGAPNSDFDRKAATLFTKKYFFHAWNETSHTVDGEDWSLPPWVKAARYSGIQISPKLVSAEFPGRIQRAVHSSWREAEPTAENRDPDAAPRPAPPRSKAPR
jgi:hypothetical protein